ncbi:MarR family winged helix-turn-helix transcriptional regulator [Ruegeria atlantica]|uniref:Organic hydroperoxide resistance transcriptional regulator n=1 Tax=Ruegeria atlantica TaxID=81569 RepID=A0A0P1EAI8_9RHOB|nr:MarR family winged helix-turn-helix transcriptional regulator [Ruegeria atlantica]CUH46359.1 Organic hydroperoxide resistance transcriptional regulator [Ruegeria atlantica]
MDFEKENSAGYLVNHMARLFAKELQHHIAPLGIVVGQFPVLLELWLKDGVTQKDLLARIDVEQATLANTLNRMERDGLIKRTKNPADARAQLIWLTEKAAALRNRAYESAQNVNSQALQVLTEHEQAQFMGYMRRVISGIRSS